MKPVHHEVKAALLRRLQTLPLDSRLPSDRDLAREFNVAFLTINRVMNDLMREGYVVRRPRQGTFLASRERQLANHADDGKDCILFAYPNYFSHHIFSHLRLAEELALKNRIRLVEYKLSPDSTVERLLGVAESLEDLRGLVLMPFHELTTPEALRRLDALDKPAVLMPASVDMAGLKHLHRTDVDWFALGHLAASTLIRAGHRRIAWLNHEPDRPDALAKGMREALKEHGLRGADLSTIGNGIAAWADSREAAYRLSQRMLDEGTVTAAYCDSINGVRGALRALWERGLRAPEHLSLIAAGNQSGDEAYYTPPLTTIDADWAAEMQHAFALILGRSRPAERSFTTPIVLHERGSISAPRPG